MLPPHAPIFILTYTAWLGHTSSTKLTQFGRQKVYLLQSVDLPLLDLSQSQLNKELKGFPHHHAQ